MSNKRIVKISSLILLMSILLSVFSVSVFAETEENEATEEEYTFWEDLEMMGVLILGAILSPILTLANWLHELFGFAPLI